MSKSQKILKLEKTNARVSHEIVVLLNIDLYFLCLDAKKVTKKNQGQPEPSGRLSAHATYLASTK